MIWLNIQPVTLLWLFCFCNKSERWILLHVALCHSCFCILFVGVIRCFCHSLGWTCSFRQSVQSCSCREKFSPRKRRSSRGILHGSAQPSLARSVSRLSSASPLFGIYSVGLSLSLRWQYVRFVSFSRHKLSVLVHQMSCMRLSLTVCFSPRDCSEPTKWPKLKLGVQVKFDRRMVSIYFYVDFLLRLLSFYLDV